jgi:hypothetical protein
MTCSLLAAIGGDLLVAEDLKRKPADPARLRSWRQAMLRHYDGARWRATAGRLAKLGAIATCKPTEHMTMEQASDRGSLATGAWPWRM